MIIDKVFQYFASGLGYIVRPADYNNAFWIDQLLGYHINDRFAVNNNSLHHYRVNGANVRKVKKMQKGN